MTRRIPGLGALGACFVFAVACGDSDKPILDDTGVDDTAGENPDTLLPEPVDVISNGGFELGKELPDDWTIRDYGVSASRVVGTSPEGGAHLEMAADAGGYGTLQQDVTMRAGWPSYLRLVTAWTGMDQDHGTTVWGDDLTEGVPYFSNILGDSDWTETPGTWFVPSETDYTVFDWVYDGQTEYFDDVQLLQWDPSQVDGYDAVAHLVGSAVYRIEGGVEVSGTGTVYHPLPALHQGQVPLAFRVTSDPAGAITSLSITRRWERDDVLAIGVEASSRTSIHLEAIVLETEVADPERLADFATESADPSEWLVATAIVQSDDPEIVKAALEATATAVTDEEKVAGLLSWLTNNMTGTEWPSSLDASAVFDARMGSCTGYANLGAALGRAVGVPSRVVAGYPAWYSPLQTHYIDEFYLEGRGWVRYEPQSTQPGVPQHYMTVVSVVHPEQEGKEAVSTDRWSAMGVPWMTLTEYDGDLRYYYSNDLFEVCPECDHGAFGVFNVGLEHLARLDALAEAGKTRWESFVAADPSELGEWMDSTFANVFAAGDFEAMEEAVE
jgi:hypothetical protein